ncbi:hypothetical protein [Streptacidiphilus cavernicola]|uniref:Uncharacterized protein n=1 Tax=Streptacidiphilus cavernicola TaxID=3342716 RepID=A0ABV6VXT0_9ACTN
MADVSAFTASTAAGQTTPPCLICRAETDRVTEYTTDGVAEIHYEPCGHQERIGRPTLEAWVVIQEIMDLE